MKVFKTLIYIIFLLGLTHCTSMAVTVPNPSVEVPELLGASENRNIMVQLGNFSAHRYQVTGDASQRPPNLDEPNVERDMGYFASLGTELFDRFSLSGALDPIHATGLLRAQYQWLGNSRRRSSEGDWSGALSLQSSWGQVGREGEQDGLFGPGGHPWSGKARAYTLSGGLSMGYRAVDNILIFSGLSMGIQGIRAEINHGTGGDGSSPAQTYFAVDQGHSGTWGIGALWGNSFQVQAKYEWTYVEYDRVQETETLHLFSLGLAFL